MPRDNLHLTLAFLGWVPDERVAGIREALAAAAAGVRRFVTHLEGLGAFPSERRARILWAGVADPGGRLAQVAGAVATSLARLGFPPEQRAFHAHVTLARLRDPTPIRLPPEPSPPSTPVPVEEVTLFHSTLRRPAPVYEPVAAFALAR